MQVRNIIENINFHDSNVIELFHENNKVKRYGQYRGGLNILMGQVKTLF